MLDNPEFSLEKPGGRVPQHEIGNQVVAFKGFEMVGQGESRRLRELWLQVTDEDHKGVSVSKRLHDPGGDRCCEHRGEQRTGTEKHL